jgi:hypothetical protein
MKTKIATKKDFDAVELMRSIRTQIGKDIEGMTFEQEKEYFKKASEKIKKYKPAGNIR